MCSALCECHAVATELFLQSLIQRQVRRISALSTLWSGGVRDYLQQLLHTRDQLRRFWNADSVDFAVFV
jgi:hypothetical protein